MATKTEILKNNGTYNKKHASVKAADFQQGFFLMQRIWPR